MFSTSSIVSPNKSNFVTAKFDSAASSHYWRTKDLTCLTDVSNYEGPAVTLPDGSQIVPAKRGLVPLSDNFSNKAKRATNLPQLTTSSLLAVGPICDDGNLVIFDDKKVQTIKNSDRIKNILDKENVLLEGLRNKRDGCWDIPIQKTQLHDNHFAMPDIYSDIYNKRVQNFLPKKVTSQNIRSKNTGQCNLPAFLQNMNELVDIQETNYLVNTQLKQDRKDLFEKICINNPCINVIVRKTGLKSELAQFLHGACFSPVVSTFVKAIKNNHFTTWPGLSEKLITKHLPPAIATSFGHQNKERQGVQSTTKVNNKYQRTLNEIKKKFAKFKSAIPNGKSFKEVIENELLNDFFPQSNSPNTRTNCVIHAIVDCDDVVAYGDMTGRFPYRSSRGYQYIYIAYHYDANSIVAAAMKNRNASTIVDTWENIMTRFEKFGMKPDTFVMDNECSNELKQALAKEKVGYQLVPAHDHRRNAAERAIQTFKNYFKAGLASVDPDFPIK